MLFFSFVINAVIFVISAMLLLFVQDFCISFFLFSLLLYAVYKKCHSRSVVFQYLRCALTNDFSWPESYMIQCCSGQASCFNSLVLYSLVVYNARHEVG